MPKASFIAIIIHLVFLPELSAQTTKSIIYKDIETALKHKSHIQKIEPFSWISNNGVSTIVKLKQNKLPKANDGQLLEMLVPLSKNQNISIILRESNILAQQNQWNNIKLYRGIIKGEFESWVTLNIADHQINGIISSKYGNTIIETNKNGDVEIFNSNSKPEVSWTCHEPIDRETTPYKSHTGNKSSSALDTIKMYVDCDYSLYQWQGKDVRKTINYVNSLFNDVAAIYQNENITLIVDDIHVWTSQDPYDKTDNRKTLYDFQDHMDDRFEADLAILLSGNSNLSGGLAFVNSLCQKSRAYSYANLRSRAAVGSNYSWQTHVVAHEIGHNLGSPHTHDCKWGPARDKALDNCYHNSCDLASTAESGTIMSYCHLSGQNGVNFSKGFGQEPGDTIRATVAACRDLSGVNCLSALPIDPFASDTIIITSGPKMGDGASQKDTEHAIWYKMKAPFDGYISINSCSKGVDTRVHIHSGSCGRLERHISVDDNCNMGNGLNYASRIDSFPVFQGTTYFIEWDNRWSTNGFSFDFNYEFDEPFKDLCNNGILDEGEEDIDCGGIHCVPCATCESHSYEGTGHVVTRSELRSNRAVVYDGTISNTGIMTISSGQSINLEAGFEIQAGGLLEALIESCAEYFERITSATNN